MKILFRNIRSGKRQAEIVKLNSITRKALEEVLDRQVKPTLLKSHKIIVADWEHKPDFGTKKYITAEQIAVSIFPTGENAKIWTFVDQGTKAHPIPKSPMPPGKFLVFPWGGPGSYVSKTLARPARTVKGGGYVKNPTLQFRKQVNHPGTQAREFTPEIAEDIKPDFQKTIENTFRAIARQVEE